MTAEPSPGSAPTAARRAWIVLALVAVALVIGVFVVRARRQAAAADCEKAPPKVEFAVAECDAGAAPGAGGSAHPAASPTPSSRP